MTKLLFLRLFNTFIELNVLSVLNYFTVSKKSGDVRIILNLKPLNKHVAYDGTS